MSDCFIRTVKGLVMILVLAFIAMMALLTITIPKVVLILIGIVVAAYLLGTAWETVVTYGGKIDD